MVFTAPSPMLRDPLPVDSRYECLLKIASGGMAAVYVGRLRGAVGFWRLVAVKRAHAHLIEDPAFRRLLVAEARLASKIHHPNVVAVQDVEELAQELFLVMDYVEGAALSELDAKSSAVTSGPLPAAVVVRIGIDACQGLHAAHELTDDAGAPLGLVHRDVSPQNLLVGLDGVTRIADFGIAKCVQSGTSVTTTGALKGKVAYMAPEYIEGDHVDARGDVFALGVVLWEAFTGQRLFRGPTELDTLRRVVDRPAPKLSTLSPGLAPFDAVIARALEKAPSRRFQSARDLGAALEDAARGAGMHVSHAEVAATVRALVNDELERRRVRVREHIAGSSRAAQVPEGGAGAERETEESSIHVSFTELPVPGLAASVDAESSTLGSSVSSRRIMVQRAARARRRRVAVIGAAAMAAAAVLIWRLAVRPVATPELEQAAEPAQAASPPRPVETSAASAASALASAPASAATTAPTASAATVAATATTAPARAPSSPARAVSKPHPRPPPSARPADPTLAPPAPNPYAN